MRLEVIRKNKDRLVTGFECDFSMSSKIYDETEEVVIDGFRFYTFPVYEKRLNEMCNVNERIKKLESIIDFIIRK